MDPLNEEISQNLPQITETKEPKYDPNKEIKIERDDFIPPLFKVELISEDSFEIKSENEPPEPKIECSYCPDYNICQKDTLNNHILKKQTIVTDNTFYKCGLCSFNTETSIKLKNHFIHKHKAKSHQCRHCPFKTKGKDSLQNHIIVKHTADAEIQWFQCDQCDYKGKCRHNLLHHFKTKHIENLEEFQCQECEYSTKMKRNLLLHMKSRHSSDIKWVYCGECSYKTKRKYYLKLHKMSKHPLL